VGKKIFFLTAAILFISFFSIQAFASEITIKPSLGTSQKADPSINVTVGSSQVLQNTIQSFIQRDQEKISTILVAGPIIDTAKNQTIFTFKPSSFLENGNYSFFFSIQDQQGNTVNASAPFVISVDYMRIELLQPNLGMSSTPNFDVLIKTQYDSIDCRMGKKLSFIDQDNLEDVYRSASKQLKPTDSSKQEWIWRNLSETSNGAYIPYWFVCTYSSPDNYNLFSHSLGFDTTPPTITFASASPNPVVDPSNRETKITINTDDLAICKYKDLYSGEIFLSNQYTVNNISNYKTTREIIHDYSSQIIDGFTRILPNGSTETYPGPFVFKYQAICQNLAGNESRKNFSVTVKIDTTIGIEKITPHYVKSKDIDFKVRTKIGSACSGNIQGEDLTDFSSEDSNIHTLRITNLQEGENKIFVRCSAQETEEKTFTVFVDTKPPETPTINSEEISCSLTRMEAEISSEDNESGIGFLNYSVYKGNTIQEGWRTTNDNPDDVRVNIDLEEGEDYTWKVFAIDKAGNIGPTKTFSVEAVGPAVEECDSEPPEVSVNIVFEQPGATMLNLTCEDMGIGCKNDFDYSLEQEYGDECSYNKTKSFDQNFLVEQTSYLCYKAQDLNDNTATGKRKISIIQHNNQETPLNQSCFNDVKDQGETDVDCGGVCTQLCQEGKNCETSYDCESSYCSDEGIVLLSTMISTANNNFIGYCKFVNNCDGIEMQQSSMNTIDSCIFNNNYHSGIDGINSNNNNNIIQNCTITNNSVHGIYITNSQNNTIKDSYFYNNTDGNIITPQSTSLKLDNNIFKEDIQKTGAFSEPISSTIKQPRKTSSIRSIVENFLSFISNIFSFNK